MIFITIALLISIGLALVISSDIGSLVGLTQDQTGQIIALLMVLILVAGGAFSKRIKFSDMLVSILLWLGLFLIVIIGYMFREDIGNFAGRVAGELAPGNATISSEGDIALFHRSMGGSFRLNAKVENVNLSMIFDTGASVVVLSHDDAIRVGIDLDGLTYNVRVQTANGVTNAASVILDSIEVGGIKRNNIKAFVVKDDLLKTSLLGMSFLETLTGYSVMNDRLELRN